MSSPTGGACLRANGAYGAGVRLVLVDNDKAALDLIELDLALEGHEIVGTAAQADEAIDIVGRTHPDVVVHVAALDDHLNDVGYIVPGLGDAGDRQNATGADDPTDQPFIPEEIASEDL
jgi:hypothetical protein